MMQKKKIEEEKGSMAVYVTIVLMVFLIILTTAYISITSVRKGQLETILKIKESYEQGNDKIDETYQQIVSQHVYFEDFKTWNQHTMSATETPNCHDSILTLTSTGNAPQITMDSATSFNPKEYRYMDIKYRTSSPAGSMKITVEDQVLVEKEPTNPPEEPEYKTVYYTISGDLTCDGNWHILTLDLGSNQDMWNKNPITGWTWQWASTSGVTMDIDYIRIHK